MGYYKNSDVVIEISTIREVEKERIVPIPIGYSASKVEGEDTVSEGLVIYQTGDTNTVVTEENHANALKTYNQYVWIPVDDINSMIMCKSNTGSSVCNLELQSDGNLKCTNPEHLATATDLCGRMYVTVENYTNINFNDRTQTYTLSDNKEPDIVNDTFYGDVDDRPIEVIHDPDIPEDDHDSGIIIGSVKMELAGISDGKVATFLNQLTLDFTEMANSVAKYGGFYVARYEAGVNGESKKEQETLVAKQVITQYLPDYITGYGYGWHGLYNVLRNNSTHSSYVESHMIWRKPVGPNGKIYRRRGRSYSCR